MNYKKKRWKVRIRKMYNESLLLPGKLYKPIKIPPNYIENQYVRIWNAVTNIPLADHKERKEVIIEILEEIKYKYHQQGSDELYKRIKEFNEK